MQIHLGVMCRSKGKASIELIATKQSPESHFVVRASSENGIPLPLEKITLPSDKELKEEGVYITPWLDTKYVNLDITEVDALGQPLDSRELRIRRTLIKWASKFNYFFRRAHAIQIRDIDQDSALKRMRLQVTAFLRANTTPQEFIVKGVVSASPSEGGINFFLLNRFGDIAPSFKLYEGDQLVVNNGITAHLEKTFTARIPDDGSDYCLVASSGNDEESAFFNLDHDAINTLLHSCPQPPYEVAAFRGYAEKAGKSATPLANARLSERINDFNLKISIVVPLFNTPPSFLSEMIASVRSQSYPRWELVLVNASPTNIELRACLDEHTNDPRIKIVSLEENLGIAENTNQGINAATGDYIMLVDHDDVLSSNALFAYAEYIFEHPSVDAIYCDEDILDEKGNLGSPHFKSDFNIDLLRCHNYITHLLCVRSSLLKSLLLRSEYNGAQDYDLVLRLSEKTSDFGHINDVLYHWRAHDNSTAKDIDTKSYADENGRRALQDHLDRCGIKGTATLTELPCIYHVDYALNELPLVSIVITCGNETDSICRCLDSLATKTIYQNYEIIVVTDEDPKGNMSWLDNQIKKSNGGITKLKLDNGSTDSAMKNYGVAHARSDFIILVNDNVEVISPNWIGSMLSFCQREDVGVVGAKLLSYDNTIQNAGIVMVKDSDANLRGGPVAAFKDLDRNDCGYMYRSILAQDVSAVSANCLMVKRNVFNAVNGFDKYLDASFNDVDFCLKVREKGYLVVFDPDALLYAEAEHMSTEYAEQSAADRSLDLLSQQERLRSRWPEYYMKGDPYHRLAYTEE